MARAVCSSAPLSGAIASSMSPHASPKQGLTPIFSAAAVSGIKTVQTASAAAETLPTAPIHERYIAARAKGYCTDRAIFTLFRCTTDELIFSCCDSVAAHFKHAATRQPRRMPTVQTCVPQESALALRAAVSEPYARNNKKSRPLSLCSL
jgi:hypothetical protein